MATTLYLIRHGVTAWHAERRVLGQRDVPLSAAGIHQGERVAAHLAETEIVELLASPLQRAVQTAEIIGERSRLQVARDPRLVDFDVGEWSGRSYDQLSADESYARFMKDPDAERIPGGESLGEIRDRSVSAIEQILEDNPSGDAVAIVTHAGIIRVLLAHYLGSPVANFHRIRVNPGSVSVLAFASERELPRVLAINHSAPLSELSKDGGLL